jgi:hypothetical protein
VGPVSANTSVRSQTQASPPSCEAISESSRSRTGSPIALNTRARSTARSTDRGSRTRGEQHPVAVAVVSSDSA